MSKGQVTYRRRVVVASLLRMVVTTFGRYPHYEYLGERASRAHRRSSLFFNTLYIFLYTLKIIQQQLCEFLFVYRAFYRANQPYASRDESRVLFLRPDLSTYTLYTLEIASTNFLTVLIGRLWVNNRTLARYTKI